MPESDLPPRTINDLRTGAELSFAMLAGIQLEVFSHLAERPLTLEQLAGVLGVRAVKLRPLAYALVVAGLLEVEKAAGEDAFRNTAEAARYLVKGKPGYLGGVSENLVFRWNALLRTAESIRTGVPQAKLDFAAGDAQSLERFLRGIQGEAMISGRELAAQVDLSGVRRLADVGGGSGGLAIALAERYPQLAVTVVDLPSVTPIAQRIIDEAGAGQRVSTMAADAVDGAIAGTYDAAVLRALIQVLSPEGAVKALGNVHHALAPGGAIHIIGRTLDDSRLAPIASVGFSLMTLNVFDDGQAYTEQEYREWLAAAGFVEVALGPLGGGPNTLISARKPG